MSVKGNLKLVITAESSGSNARLPAKGSCTGKRGRNHLTYASTPQRRNRELDANWTNRTWEIGWTNSSRKSNKTACGAFEKVHTVRDKRHVLYLRDISEKDGKFYTGFTSDLRNRLNEHNTGKVLSTKGRGPFALIYYEACLNEQDATSREKYLKSGMGKLYLKNRLKRFLSPNPLETSKELKRIDVSKLV